MSFICYEARAALQLAMLELQFSLNLEVETFSYNSFLKMDYTEVLITEVQKRRALWDMRDKQYHNIFISDKNWIEVAAAVNMSSKSHTNVRLGFPSNYEILCFEYLFVSFTKNLDSIKSKLLNELRTIIASTLSSNKKSLILLFVMIHKSLTISSRSRWRASRTRCDSMQPVA